MISLNIIIVTENNLFIFFTVVFNLDTNFFCVLLWKLEALYKSLEYIK